jgi:hypothetical protein
MLHDQKGYIALLSELVDRDDIFVAQVARSGSFVFEAIEQTRILGRSQDLDSDDTVHDRIEGAIHLPESTASDFGLDLESTEARNHTFIARRHT